KGMKFPEIASELAEARVINHPSWFRLYAMKNGLANKVRAGTYEIKDDLTPRQLLATLIKGVEEIDVAVTIPEGRNLREVAAIIDQAGIANAGELEQIARDPEWLKQQGIDGETAE